MKGLPKRHEAIDHVRHFGRNDPNGTIYGWHIESRDFEKAKRFLAYREAWEAARSGGRLPDHPLFVTFGLADSCNLSCAHCYRTYNRDRTRKRFLKFDEIRSLVDECKRIGVPSIGLGTESELFMHKDAAEVVRYVSAKGFEDVWISTNGLLLTDGKMDLILDSNVTRMSVSIDAVTNQTYATARGPGFFKVMANVFRFLHKREEKKTRLPVLRVTFIKYNLTQAECDRFVTFWRGVADEVDVQSLIDVKNVDILRYDRIGKVKCNYPSNMLYINWNGDYKPCCSEFCKHLTIGNITNMNLLEAWHSVFLNDLRGQLAGKKPLNKVCLNCLRSLRSKESYEPLKLKRCTNEKRSDH